MSTERLFTLRNPWFAAGIGFTSAMVVLSFIVGFILLPYAGMNSQLTGLWDAICSAAGVPRATAVSDIAKPDFTTSDVVMNSQTFGLPDTRSVGRGATLAMQCAICHGSNQQGQVDTPNLQGQPAASVYKQLRDFKVAARTSAIMSPFAVKLSEQDMLDLAAYYSYLPRQPGSHPDHSIIAPQIVVRGAPMRNIAACASCHGMRGAKLGTPWLEGQSAVYLKAQLHAFATGGRRNDISEQMRNIARRMTDTEINVEASHYYSSQP
jgi:cytochrome c553